MPLPEDFSPFEHLQDTVKKVHNRLVKEEFSDLGDDTWDTNITTPRASLRTACTLNDNDTADMVQMRYNLFYFDLRKAKDLQVPVYGMPLPDVQASRKFKPQITLYFIEDSADVEDKETPVAGEISFRLMNETSLSMTKDKLKALANKIKTEFGVSNGYVWKKGKKYFSYTDKDRGYQLQLLCRDEAEAKALITKVLSIRGYSSDWKKFKTNTTDSEAEVYPYTPPSMVVMGETIKEPRRRPNVDVRFSYAEAAIWGLRHNITLYDRGKTMFDALVE